MFYCGIDWSEDHHNLCILNEAGGRVSQLQFEHSLAGFAQIEVERRKLEVPAGECFVGIETAYHLIVDFLLEHDYPTYIVPPRATQGYRNRSAAAGHTTTTAMPPYWPASCAPTARVAAACA